MSDDLIGLSLADLLMGSPLILRCCSSEPLGLGNWRVLGDVASLACSLAYSQSGGFGMVLSLT